MGRIKQGLDYFPLSTDFMHDRIVRRVMKREGDSAFTVLIYIMSYLYSGEGYYVRADTDFCDELSDQLFSTDNDTVRRVIRLFLEYGLFDSALYERYSILTSAGCPAAVSLHHQTSAVVYRYLSRIIVCCRKKKTTDEQPRYCMPQHGENVAVSPNIATGRNARGYCNKNSSHKKRKEKKENILPNPPFAKGGDEEEEGSEGEKVAEGAGGGMREECDQRSATRKRNLTQEDIDRMQVPPDGCPRNFSGLLGESPSLSCSSCLNSTLLVLKSNYGDNRRLIYGKALAIIRGSGGKIKLPGHYLLSVLNK